MTSARRIRMYPLIFVEGPCGIAVSEVRGPAADEPVDIHHDPLDGNSGRDRSVSSRIRSRACWMALFEGQRAGWMAVLIR
jgi:hypothetical protein